MNRQEHVESIIKAYIKEAHAFGGDIDHLKVIDHIDRDIGVKVKDIVRGVHGDTLEPTIIFKFEDGEEVFTILRISEGRASIVVEDENQSDGHYMDVLSRKIYEDNKRKGFWDDGGKPYEQAMLLVISEIIESFEALRAGDIPDDKLPQYRGQDVEIADALIRLLDWCGAHKIPIGEIIEKKLEYNRSRPHKHGKLF